MSKPPDDIYLEMVDLRHILAGFAVAINVCLPEKRDEFSDIMRKWADHPNRTEAARRALHDLADLVDGRSPEPPAEEPPKPTLAIGQLAIAQFPVRRPAVGWFPEWDEQPRSKRRHTPEELERRLARQKENTFGRRWFDDFIAAQNAALAKADQTKSVRQREAIEEAVEAASQVVAEAIDQGKPPEIDFTAALRAAADASRVTASIKHAVNVLDQIREAEARAKADFDDDEDVALLLLLG